MLQSTLTTATHHHQDAAAGYAACSDQWLAPGEGNVQQSREWRCRGVRPLRPAAAHHFAILRHHPDDHAVERNDPRAAAIRPPRPASSPPTNEASPPCIWFAVMPKDPANQAGSGIQARAARPGSRWLERPRSPCRTLAHRTSPAEHTRVVERHVLATTRSLVDTLSTRPPDNWRAAQRCNRGLSARPLL